MSYRCQVCRGAAPPGTKMMRHVLHRPSTKHAGMEVAAEIAVCQKCADDLNHGFPLADLIEARRPAEIRKVESNTKTLDAPPSLPTIVLKPLEGNLSCHERKSKRPSAK